MVVLWVLGFLVLKVTAAAIHLLVAGAIVALLVHVVRGTGHGLPGRT
jgi:hypothetical protein